LDGATSGHVDVPMSETLATVSTAFTLEAWIKPTDVSEMRPIVDRRDGGIQFSVMPGGTLRIELVLNGNDALANSVPVVPLNTWTHVAATYDGAMLRLFMNGTQVGSAAATGSLSPTLQPFWCG